MKAFLKTLALFIPFFIAVYIILILIYGNFIPQRFQKNLLNVNTPRVDFLYTRLLDIKKYRNVDILFLGSSHAYKGFDTRIFAKYGYTSFNLGCSSQTPVQSEFFLRTYLQQLNPKLVVIETFPFFFQSDNAEPDLNITLNLPAIGFNKISIISNFVDIKVINNITFQMASNLVGITVKPNYHDKNAKYINGGFVETYNRKFDSTLVNLYLSDKWHPKTAQKTAFESIIRLLKERHIKLIMVQAPVRKRFYNFIKNMDEVDSYFKSKGTYYNFNKIINLRDTIDFYNAHHLTQSGVEQFDKAFIELCLKPQNTSAKNN